ncbi:MAG: D-sedoheptulose 7-phosphate isomerase [Phycisphaerales bacterium]|nr:D-sedoheptulose 7-phosphate isomerase [Phycisphaerales bacterium]
MTAAPGVRGGGPGYAARVTPEQAQKPFQDARDALDAVLARPEVIAGVSDAVRRLAACFRAGSKVLACGNGGSACDAAHFAEELTGRFRADRPALPAIACVEPGHLTCVANDYGFDQVFSRWVEALGRPGDVLILLSTSGNSENIVHAAAAARERGLSTVALLGKDGGRLRGVCDLEVVVPGATADRIQELHMLILHVLVEGVEADMFGKS